MPDHTPLVEPCRPAPLASPGTPSTADLARSVRRLRVWLAVVTAVVSLFVVGACASGALMLTGFSMMGEEFAGVTEEQVAATRREFELELGDRLERIEVRAVAIDYGEAPFPYAFLEGSTDEKTLYVEYKLKGSDVLVADLVGGPMGEDAVSSGILPTEGSLNSRMTAEQFDRLLAAFAAETKSPLGVVRRYNDPPMWVGDESPVAAEVTVGTKEYRSKELWSATQGRIVEGDRVDVEHDTGTRQALIFHEDPKTGVFTYLGTEPSEVFW